MQSATELQGNDPPDLFPHEDKRWLPSMSKPQDAAVTYLLGSSVLTAGVFCVDEAGACFIDSP
jgi:hypothetical protein